MLSTKKVTLSFESAFFNYVYLYSENYGAQFYRYNLLNINLVLVT